MSGDLSRALKLISVRYFELCSATSTMLLSMLAMIPAERWAPNSVAAPLSLLGTMGALVGFWAWVWWRVRPSLEEDFSAAAMRLGGSPLSEASRLRLREALDRLLPRDLPCSVPRAFRVRENGVDLIVAEWASNQVTDAFTLAETQLVVVLPDCDAMLPTFHLEPEGPVTRFSEWLHARTGSGAARRMSEDVDFKRDPEWSRRWFLCGPRRCELRGLFRRRVRDVFRRIRRWRASGRGRWLVLRFPRAVAPENLAERVREAARLAERFQRAAAAA